MDNSIQTKICKQCGRKLPLDDFRPYKSTVPGKSSTKGHATLCRKCESINVQVAKLERKDALSDADLAKRELLVEHFRVLDEAGLPPITAAAKRLLQRGDVVSTAATTLANDLSDIRVEAVRDKQRRLAVQEAAQRIAAAEQAMSQADSMAVKALSSEAQAFVDRFQAGGYDDWSEASDAFAAVCDELYKYDAVLADAIDNKIEDM